MSLGVNGGLFTASSDLDRHVGRYYGKYPGIVKDVDDPQRQGRIKVHLPTVFTQSEPQWARPCFASGHFFVPPVDAHVWVEFEAGDPQYPLWVGTWYPQNDVPPEAANDGATSRVIHTPSGHLVEFSDADGEEKIVVRHKLNAYMSIDKTGSVIIANPNGSLIYLNADKGELSVVSEHGHRVLMNDDTVSLTHSDGAFVNLKGDEATVSASKRVQILGNEVSLTGGAVSVGPGPVFNVVVASPAFDLYLAGHTHPTAVGPSGPALFAGSSMSVASTSMKASP